MDSEDSKGGKRNQLGDNAKDWFPEGQDWAVNITKLQKPVEDPYEVSWLIEDWSSVSQSPDNLIFQFEGGPLTKHTWELELDMKDVKQLKCTLKLKGIGGGAQFLEARTSLYLFNDGPKSRKKPPPFTIHDKYFKLENGGTIFWTPAWPTKVKEDILRVHLRLLIKIPFKPDEIKHSLVTSSSSLASPPSKETLIKDIGSLFQSKDHADLKLVVGDVEILAHKNILSVRSPVFAAMLATQMTENAEGRVVIEDFDPEVVNALLEYIYTGKAEVKEVATGDLLLIAEKYEVAELVRECELALISELDIPNAAQLLKLGYLVVSAVELKNQAIDFIKWNIEEVSKTEGYQELAKSSPELLTEILLWKK